MTSGPGPKYKLPPTIGYDFHDVTRLRYPAYSLSSRTQNVSPATGIPGPNRYFPNEKISRSGIVSVPQAVILSRNSFDPNHNGIPAPNRYSPVADPSWAASPSAVVLSRHDSIKRSGGIPGPKYMLNGTIGSATQDLPHEPSWHIVGRTYDNLTGTRNSPGPKYGPCKLEIYKRKAPDCPISGRNPTSDSIKQTIPGPKYLGDYQKVTKEAPAWSFGVKHSEKKTMVTTEYDRAPFYGF